MNDMELADEIETGRLSFRRMVRRGEQIGRDLTDAEEEQIIAALRQADLAQTEIKGHMRVKDDMEKRIAELEKDWETDADYIRMAERIKELEKDAARYRWLRNDTSLDIIQYGRYLDAPKDIDAAIDAALKARA